MSQELHVKSLLETLAVGLLQQQRSIDEGSTAPVTLLNPYLRRGWEQLCALCLNAGQQPPGTLHDFVVWLHEPLHTWPVIDSTCQQLGYIQPLLQTGYPTDLCNTLASPYIKAADPYLEIQDSPFKEILAVARQIDSPEQYSKARELLDRNPLLTDVFSVLSGNHDWHDAIRDLLQYCYENVPQACIRKEKGQKYIVCCPRCGWVLNWKDDEAYCYSGGACANSYGNLGEQGQRTNYTLGMARTTEGIQRYVVAPEIDLIRIYDTLQKEWGVRCQLFPNFDMFDLLIAFPNGKVWAVDLKDYAKAAVLANKLNELPFRWGPDWDKAFYVFPDYRADQDYLNIFQVGWKPQKDVFFASTRRFIELAREELAS